MKTKNALIALSALAQESRLAVFRLLLEDDSEEGVPAGEIAERLGVPPTTMSFHLSQLKTAGLIKSSKQGKSILYSASRKKAKNLAKYITGKDIIGSGVLRNPDKKYQL